VLRIERIICNELRYSIDAPPLSAHPITLMTLSRLKLIADKNIESYEFLRLFFSHQASLIPVNPRYARPAGMTAYKTAVAICGL
jgi:hypothetical protein